MKKGLLFIFCLLPIYLYAMTMTFIEGNDYKIISEAKPVTKKIEVIEFFNYACPWCYRVDPLIEQFRKTLPADVEFRRVAVSYNPVWQQFAKAYYAAEALEKESTITPAFFKALHQDKKRLDNEENIQALFLANGISESDFKSAFHFSPGIEARIQESKDLVSRYEITGVPAIVVDGKYVTNSLYAKGKPDTMMAITNYLIEKARKERR